MASTQLQKGTVKQVQSGTRATCWNKTSSNMMTLDRSINWHGYPSTGSFPDKIQPKSNSKFVHVREGQYGSMAAVQYSGSLDKTSNPGAWILAWNAPSDDTPSPNQVYVACGSKERMDLISWDQILLNLEEASTTSEAEDPDSKTKVDAKIDDSIPNTATLVANFGFITE